MVRDRGRIVPDRRAEARVAASRGRMLDVRTGVSIVRLVGWLASALGLVGIIVGNGLASVVWVLKLNVQARIRDLVALPDGGLDIATTLTETVAAGRHDHDRRRSRTCRALPTGWSRPRMAMPPPQRTWPPPSTSS